MNPTWVEKDGTMYLRVTVNTIARDKSGDLREVIDDMNKHREQNGYTPVEWLTGLTGKPDEIITVQRYEKLADYEAALAQIAEDAEYRKMLGRLKECTVPGVGYIQLLKSF